jgi:hypothetical protein
LEVQREAAASDKTPVVRSLAVRFRQELINWIVRANIPFSGVEHPSFKNILMLLNPVACEVLLPGRTTVRRWVEERYVEEAALLREQLAASPYNIHLSFDLWTSPNSLALLGVVGHFVEDSTHLLRKQLLGIYRVKGSHSGENIAPTLARCIQDFGVDGRFGYFQSDNADSNNVCLLHTLALLRSELTDTERRQLCRQRRLRCFSHILKLVVKAFLEGDSKHLLKSLGVDFNSQHSLEEEEEMLKEWRKRGPIGKLHNIVHFIRRSPQRRDKFVDIVKKAGLSPEALIELGDAAVDGGFVQLVADNDSRWNSVYSMIERAIRLRDQIELFCIWSASETDAKRRLSGEDRLEPEDWVILTYVKSILEPIQRVTKMFEGHAPRFGEVIATAVWLLETLKEQRLGLVPAAEEGLQPEATATDSAAARSNIFANIVNKYK